MDTNTIIAIIGGILILVIGFVIFGLIVKASSRRTNRLQHEFGPEYEHTLEETKDKRDAERELEQRLKRVHSFEIRSLTFEERMTYYDKWKNIQAEFVEDPSQSIENANDLVTEMMIVRGYPMASFDQRVADISVNYPDVVGHYRSAHAIVQENRSSGATTERLRQALVHYRGLFASLLEIEEDDHPPRSMENGREVHEHEEEEQEEAREEKEVLRQKEHENVGGA